VPHSSGTHIFIIMFTARHLSLSRATSNHSSTPPCLWKIHFNIMLPSAPKSYEWCFSFRFFHHLCSIYVFKWETRRQISWSECRLFIVQFVKELSCVYNLSLNIACVDNNHLSCQSCSVYIHPLAADIRKHWNIECIRAVGSCNLESFTVTTNIFCLPCVCVLTSKYVYLYRRPDRLVRPCLLLFINLE
jgi:hypothetical protein